MVTKEDNFSEDTAFVAALQAGDPEAWEKFANRYSTKLRQYLSYRLPTAESIDDVLSEIFIGTVRTIGQFANDVSLSTFVYSITHRKIADYWRRQTTTVALADVTITETHELLSRLPEVMQNALLLRYYVGLSIVEIAQILGRSFKATESLLSRARQQFLHISAVAPESMNFAPNVEHDPLGAKAVFGAAYPLLLLQKQLNQQNGMSEEAKIFERAQQQVEQLAATPIPSFPELFLRVMQESVGTFEQVLLFRDLLERPYNYDNSSQL